MSNSNSQVLGFLPLPKYVYVGKSGESLWYFVENSQQIPIQSRSLRGYLVSLLIKNKTRKGQEVSKLNLIVECGEQTYIIESGSDTIFSRGILQALAQVSSLDDPLVFSVRPGDDVVFGDLFEGRNKVFYEFKKNLHSLDLMQMIAQKFPRLSVRVEGVAIKAEEKVLVDF